MPQTATEAWTSLFLSLAIGLIALLLGIGQWWEHRTRDLGLQESERKYFLYQDLRRGIGILLLAVLAPGIYIGSRLPNFATEPTPPAAAAADGVADEHNPPAPKRHPNRPFLVVWLSIFAIVAMVLGLALIDWVATRRYARRHRQALSLEKLEIFRETHRRDGSSQDGPANGAAPRNI